MLRPDDFIDLVRFARYAGRLALREAKGKVLIDRASLETSLLYTTPSRGHWRCHWIGPGCDICEYESEGIGEGQVRVIEPHTGTCPLREDT